MTPSKDKKAIAVKTVVHADHEVITPPDSLREQALIMARPESVAKFEDQALKAAEQSLQELSKHFPEWISSEIDFLEETSSAYYANRAEETLNAFYRKAHDIRGHAATMGFPEASTIADGLCLIIEKITPIEGSTFDLVRAHVDALRTGINSQITGKDNGRSLKELSAQLSSARTAKFGSKLDPV